MAASSLKRRFIGIELNEDYVKLAARRLATAYGQYIPAKDGEKRDLLWSE